MRPFLFYGGLFFLFLTGCYKRNFENLRLADANPTVLYPLVDASLTLKDIVDPVKSKLFIEEDADGFYTFVYYDEVYEKKISDLLVIPDVNRSNNINLTAGEVSSLPGSGTISKTLTGTIVLPLSNGAELHEVIAKSGNLNFSLSSTFRHNVRAIITFPSLTNNGVALTRTINLAYNTTVPVAQQVNVDLAGYIMDLTNGGASNNRIPYSIAFTVTYKSGSPVNTGQQLTVLSSLSNIQYSYAEGYLGMYNMSIPLDTVNVDIFDNAFAGNIFFEDPKVRVVIKNSIGAPSQLKINTLSTKSRITGVSPITGSVINTDIPILFPTLAQIGQTFSTTIQLDKTSSNVQTVFNPAPSEVYYALSGTINPSGKTVNFVTDSSSIKIIAEAEIPMEGRIVNFVLLDSVSGLTFPALDFNDGQIKLNDVLANFEVTNGFPMTAYVQMYFLDNVNFVVDSLFKNGPAEVQAPSLNTSGRVETPIVYMFREYMDDDRYLNISSTSSAIVVVQFKTPNSGTIPVRIYSDYRFKTRLGVKVNANVSF
ncbi:MAG: hypothetical protein U0U66_02720 [Cytophagaceae bacterium]